MLKVTEKGIALKNYDIMSYRINLTHVFYNESKEIICYRSSKSIEQILLMQEKYNTPNEFKYEFDKAAIAAVRVAQKKFNTIALKFNAVLKALRRIKLALDADIYKKALEKIYADLQSAEADYNAAFRALMDPVYNRSKDLYRIYNGYTKNLYNQKVQNTICTDYYYRIGNSFEVVKPHLFWLLDEVNLANGWKEPRISKELKSTKLTELDFGSIKINEAWERHNYQYRDIEISEYKYIEDYEDLFFIDMEAFEGLYQYYALDYGIEPYLYNESLKVWNTFTATPVKDIYELHGYSKTVYYTKDECSEMKLPTVEAWCTWKLNNFASYLAQVEAILIGMIYRINGIDTVNIKHGYVLDIQYKDPRNKAWEYYNPYESGWDNFPYTPYEVRHMSEIEYYAIFSEVDLDDLCDAPGEYGISEYNHLYNPEDLGYDPYLDVIACEGCEEENEEEEEEEDEEE